MFLTEYLFQVNILISESKQDREPSLKQMYKQEEKDLPNLLESAYESGENSDVKLICGHHVINAHKFILQLRSPVFKAMFQNDMIETNDGEVIINEVPIEVLKLLVRYMYCGKLNDSEIRKYCVDLYDAAVMASWREILEFWEYRLTTRLLFFYTFQYQLDSLKTICEKVLSSEAEKPGLARLMITVSELYNFPKLGKTASKAARK